MIYPTARLHIPVLLGGLPLVILASLIPFMYIPVLSVMTLAAAVALIDALLCLRRSHSFTIKAPETVRMYRGVATRVAIRLKTRRKISGVIIDTNTDALALDGPVAFFCPQTEEWKPYEIIVVPLVRGTMALDFLNARIDSPLALWYRIATIPIRTLARVFANNKSDSRVLKKVQSGDFIGSHTHRMAGKGRELDKLRDYVAGDTLDDIHWKATARHGRPITKEYCLERSQPIYVVIDASRSSRRIVEYMGSGARRQRLAVPLLERSVVAADMLSIIANRQADRIGLVAFDHRVRFFIKPGLGPHHLTLCRSALLDLSSGSAPADYREMFQFLAAHIQRRAMIVILANLDDPFASENFAAYVHVLAKKHMVMGVSPVSDYVQPLFSRPVASQEEIYRAVGGHVSWHAFQKVCRSVRLQGAEIFSASHRDLAVRAVEAYAAMKRRQGI